MQELTRRQFLSLVAATGGASVLAISTGCAPQTESNPASDAEAHEGPNVQAEPSATFMLMSDTHLNSDKPERAQRLANALSQIAEFERRPDAIVINGDVTDGGHQEEYDELASIIGDSSFSIGDEVLFTCGNHDQYTGDDNSQEAYDVMHERFSANLGIPLCYDRIVNGVHLVFMGPDGIGSHWDRFNITSQQVEWVEDLLAEDEANQRASIVFCHEPLPETVFGTDEGQWGHDASVENPDELQAMLNRHPQTVFVTGHTHITPDVRRVAEDSPTYVNEGSCGCGFDSHVPFGSDNPLSNGVEMNVFEDRFEFRFRNFNDSTWEKTVAIARHGNKG